MKLTLHTVILMATGLTAIPLVSIAHGISGGHMSSVETHHNDCDHDRYRYSGIYFRPPYGASGVSYYDADYCYTPTAEQMATAQEHVQDYLLTVKKTKACCISSIYFCGGPQAEKTTSRRLYQKTAAAASRALATALFEGI